MEVVPFVGLAVYDRQVLEIPATVATDNCDGCRYRGLHRIAIVQGQGENWMSQSATVHGNYRDLNTVSGPESREYTLIHTSLFEQANLKTIIASNSSFAQAV
jgi:hypothetical protein